MNQVDLTRGDRLDDLARALAAPMSRRKSLGVMAGTLLASTLTRPRGAVAVSRRCSGDTPVKCVGPQGQIVCAPAGSTCCSNDRCAVACSKPWRECAGPGICSDTKVLCTHPAGGYAAQGLSEFCSRDIHVTKGTCISAGIAKDGWCCGPGMRCGTEFDQCLCRSPRERCGVSCCQPNEFCASGFFDSNTCERLCPNGRKPCQPGICCTDLEECGFTGRLTGCSCKSGLVSCGTGRCCKPREDPGDPDGNPLSRMRDMINQTSNLSGSGPRSVFARPAQAAAADSAANRAAAALGVVNGQGAAALLAIRSSKRDSAFRRAVTVARVKPPTVVAGPGLDAASAAALNRLLVAEAKANALVLATGKALWRARAAHAKKNKAAAKTQMRAASSFADQASKALKRVQALRTAAAKALDAGQVAELYRTEKEVATLLAQVKAKGVPTAQTAELAKVGITGADLRRLRQGLLTTTVASASGAALIGPLTSRTRAAELRALISSLSRFSARARRHPIAR